jgi:hypothetical protein
MTTACANCKFYDGDGACHLHPPVRLPRRFTGEASAGNRVRDEEIFWGWPQVKPDDWCGDGRDNHAT